MLLLLFKLLSRKILLFNQLLLRFHLVLNHLLCRVLIVHKIKITAERLIRIITVELTLKYLFNLTVYNNLLIKLTE